MSIIETIKHRRKAARIRRETRFIINRDDGCVFCKRAFDDDPFVRYVRSPIKDSLVLRDLDSGKAFAVCPWHEAMRSEWADSKKRTAMNQFLHEYLNKASEPF